MSIFKVSATTKVYGGWGMLDHNSAYSVTPLSLSSKVKNWEVMYVRRQPPACWWWIVRGKLAEQEHMEPLAVKLGESRKPTNKSGYWTVLWASRLPPHSTVFPFLIIITFSLTHVSHSCFASVYVSIWQFENVTEVIWCIKQHKTRAFFSVFSKNGISGKRNY